MRIKLKPFSNSQHLASLSSCHCVSKFALLLVVLNDIMPVKGLSALHKSIHPLEMEINPSKTERGYPKDVLYTHTNTHTHTYARTQQKQKRSHTQSRRIVECIVNDQLDIPGDPLDCSAGTETLQCQQARSRDVIENQG